MNTDEKRNFMLEVERHAEDWWSVHLTPVSGEGNDNITATCSAWNVEEALHAAAHTISRDIGR